MKKILLLVLGGLLVFSSCQDTLEKEFKNPMVYSPDISNRAPGLFTNALTQWKFYIKDYGEWWWQLESGVFQYSGLASRYISYRYSWFEEYDDLINGNGFQQEGLTWFNDYYTRMKSWGLIRDQLQELSGADYDDNVIYLSLTSIIKDWGALRNVDLYNSIPYKGAFQGTQGVFFVPYDDPKEIYVMALDDLKKIAADLPGQYEKMSSGAKALLAKQDLAFKGDIGKWVQYVNALRLRYAVNISGVAPDVAKPHITEAIANLPQTDFTWAIPFVTAAEDLPGGGTWQRGLYESAFRSFIPTGIINRMNFHDLKYEPTIDDPRLPVLALPTKWNDYRGVTYNIDVQTPLYDSGEKYYPYCDNIVSSSQQNSRCMWSHVTYTHNDMPADMVTLGEIDLLLAEVALKGLVSTPKTAGDYIKDAVVHSTDFWYAMNALSSYGNDVSEPWKSLIKPAKPSADIVSSYANKVKAAFEAKADLESKMEVLMIQKQIHINILEPYQFWGDLRRTRHPKLEKMTYKGNAMAPMVERLRYPSSEVANNTEFYLKVAAQDNLTTPIFWVPDSKKTENYYRNTDVSFKTSETPNFD